MRVTFPLKIALLSFLIAGTGVTTVALLTFGYASGLLLDQSLENVSRDLERETAHFAAGVVGMVDDGRFFATSEGVKGLIRAIEGGGYDDRQNMTSELWRGRLERQFTTAMHDRSAYTTIRVIGIDDGGRELVRVDRRAEAMVVASHDTLQRKGERDYFKRTIAAPLGSHYISPANLNREWGRIVYPHEPTLRVGVPLSNGAGEPFGALVINADFGRLTADLRSGHPDLHYLVTNRLGDYLFHPEASKRFLFELGRRARLLDEFPELAEVEHPRLDGEAGHRRGYAIGTAVSALTAGGERAVVVRELLFPSSGGERRFQVGAVVSYRVLEQQVKEFWRVLMWLIVTTSVLLAVVLALAARYLTRPIVELTHAADRIAAGDEVVRVPEGGSDEIGRLAGSLRAMLGELSRSHDELRALNDSLELQVSERTRDLDDALKRVEASAAAKSEFLANMSHELRTPMHAILSFAAMAREKLDDAPTEKIAHYLQRIDESGARLLYLLNDLLDLSKLEAGMMEFNIAEHDLHEVVLVACSEFDELLRGKGLELVVHTPEGAMSARFDRERILQVIRNLVSNAVKFSPAEGLITVTCRADRLNPGRAALALTVTDLGIGIPEEEIDMVFDKFVQSSKTKNGAGGTGLGLAICREIIDGHDGYIWAEPNPAGGSAFTFLIPRMGPGVDEG